MPLIQSAADLRTLLKDARTIAVVGASPRPERDSHEILAYLLAHGYQAIPVNPGIAGKPLLGQMAYARLSDIPVPVDIVDIFRASDQVPPIVDDAIAIGARAVWLQLGVINPAAVRTADQAGLNVVMDRCIKVDHARLIGRG